MEHPLLSIFFCKFYFNQNFISREWNCDTCKNDIKEIADAYRTKEAADKIIEAYKGRL